MKTPIRRSRYNRKQHTNPTFVVDFRQSGLCSNDYFFAAPARTHLEEGEVLLAVDFTLPYRPTTYLRGSGAKRFKYWGLLSGLRRLGADTWWGLPTLLASRHPSVSKSGKRLYGYFAMAQQFCS